MLKKKSLSSLLALSLYGCSTLLLAGLSPLTMLQAQAAEPAAAVASGVGRSGRSASSRFGTTTGAGAIPTDHRGDLYIQPLRNKLLARRLGVRVPEDVSVVGYDDVEPAAHSFPPLTTVRQPIARNRAATSRS